MICWCRSLRTNIFGTEALCVGVSNSRMQKCSGRVKELHAAGSLSFYLQQGRVEIKLAVPVEVTGPSAASSSVIVCDAMILRGREQGREQRNREIWWSSAPPLRSLYSVQVQPRWLMSTGGIVELIIPSPNTEPGLTEPGLTVSSVSAVHISGVTRTFVQSAASVVSTVFATKVKLEALWSSSVCFKMQSSGWFWSVLLPVSCEGSVVVMRWKE